MKDVIGYEGLYCASSKGEVYKYLPDGSLYPMKPYVNSKGYVVVFLRKDRVQDSVYLHKIVSSLYLDNPDCCKRVTFRDENKQNCQVSNLLWIKGMQTTLPSGCKWIDGFEGLYYRNDKDEVFNSKGVVLKKIAYRDSFKYLLSKGGKKYAIYVNNFN